MGGVRIGPARRRGTRAPIEGQRVPGHRREAEVAMLLNRSIRRRQFGRSQSEVSLAVSGVQQEEEDPRLAPRSVQFAEHFLEMAEGARVGAGDRRAESALVAAARSSRGVPVQVAVEGSEWVLSQTSEPGQCFPSLIVSPSSRVTP